MSNRIVARICSSCGVRYKINASHIQHGVSAPLCENCRQKVTPYKVTNTSRFTRGVTDRPISYNIATEMESDFYPSDGEYEDFPRDRVRRRVVAEGEPINPKPQSSDAEIEDFGNNDASPRAKLPANSSSTLPSRYFALKNDAETRARLAQYTLFAFVLYDPEQQIDIYQTLQKNYQMLDEQTGSDLLFFSFVKPSKKWLRDRMKKYPNRTSIWQDALDHEGSRRFSQVVENEYADPEIIISLVTQQLSITREQLPCIVVTTSLHEKHPMIITPFEKEDIIRKLIKLGDIASGIRKLPPQLKEVDKLAGHISRELTNSFEQQVIKSEIDDISTNLLEIMDISEYQDAANVRERLDRYLVSINHLREKIEFYAKSDQFIQYNIFSRLERIDGYCTYLWKLLAANAQFDHAVTQELPDEQTEPELLLPIDGLEEESNVFLRTQHQIMKTYERLHDDAESIDYSPLMISLTKIIELEINLSVVHILRALKGVDLPAFFNTYQPNVAAVYQSGSRTIDFNRPDYYRKRLILPGMGESLRVTEGDVTIQVRDTIYEIIRGHHDISKPKWNREFAKLLDYWRELYPMRNIVAHTERVGQDNYNSLVELLQSIQTLMPYLVTVKAHLRSAEPNLDSNDASSSVDE